MIKQKTHRGISKRAKTTAGGKIIRRHQLAKGHLRSKKSKKKTQQYQRGKEFSKGDLKKIRRLLRLS